MGRKRQPAEQEDKNLFSRDGLFEIADFESHLNFAEALIEKYNWDAQTKKHFKRQLAKIRKKHKDKLLNLGIIGEFGTGKSTFINAMLRHDEFLVSSALQGTTIAATTIEDSDGYAIVTETLGGRRRKESFESLDSLKEALVSFTTNPEVGKKLRNVIVRLPSTPLAAGFRIIDTPGTNSNESWHEEVTVRTIHEMADMYVLIVDANKPLSESFCRFVTSNLSDMLNQCVFVVTRIEMIRKRERDGVLDFIRQKICSEFGLSDPIILPYAAVELMESCDKEKVSPLAAASLKSEEIMLSHVVQQKIIAQTKKLVNLIDAMYQFVADEMEELSESYKNELDFLQKSQQTDLSPFVNRQISDRTASFKEKTDLCHPEVTEFIENLAQQAYNNIMCDIDSTDSVEKLNFFTNYKLTEHCSNHAKNIASQTQEKYDRVSRLFNEEMKLFEKDFEELFNNLDILKVDFGENELELPSIPEIASADLDIVKTYIKQQLSKETTASLSGALAGATLGSLFLPGAGTVIGGLVGFMGGARLVTKIDDVKKNLKEKLKTPLKSYFSDVAFKTTSSYDSYVDEVHSCIENEINRYLTSYQSAVSEQIAAEKKKISDTEEKIKLLNTDMESITQRKFTLNSLNNQLNILSGKEN